MRQWFLLSVIMVASLSGCQDGNKSLSGQSEASSAVVVDSKTRLQWLRCAVGQTLKEGRCEGGAEPLTLAEAQRRVNELNAQKHHGVSTWRLPSIVELAALRKCDHGFVSETFTLPLMPEQEPLTLPRWCAGETSSPTIDLTRFPDTPPSKFWSGDGSEADQHFYSVNFANAWIGPNESPNERFAVRPVADLER